MSTASSGRVGVGILDHTGSSLGGAQLVVAHLAEILSQRYDVEIIHPGAAYTIETLARSFDLDLRRVKERRIENLPASFAVPGTEPSLRAMMKEARSLTERYDLFLYSGHGVPPFCYARRGLVYCHFPMESSPDQGLQKDPRWVQRRALDRWWRWIAYRFLWRQRMNGYDKILANSSFTAKWIERRWGRRAEVLYPPVDLCVPKSEKRNLIVSVGRFTGGGRSKNQFAQVQAFREFLMQVSGWQLCLIGSYGEMQEDQTYLSAVRQAAQGLPVTFLLRVDRDAICRTLAEAKLFWHTAGLSVNEAESPEWLEHFGIATVEAMRAGCVPIVTAAGGQLEIVEDSVNGFLIQDLRELSQKSATLARDEILMARVSGQAQQRSLAFTREDFDRRIRQITARWLGER
jgi:glycosyltransferase involved in cell wall biosynthesis